MCGIVGLVGSGFSDQNKRRTLSSLQHRGPDFMGAWSSHDGQIFLGHQRLAIIDLSEAGNQPFVDEETGCVIVYNGEIYNYLELKSDLEKKGLSFRTSTDTEVLLKGLIHEGIGFQDKCNGMWAFFLWNPRTKSAIFSRDRFGIKPFYFIRNLSLGKSFAFASEMKALTHLFGGPKPIQNIDEYFANPFLHETSSSTPIEGIQKLLPGHMGTWQDGEVRILRWWNTLDHIQLNTDNYLDQLEEWRSLFLDSIRLRLRADVAVGSALSGGLDSSSIVASIHQIETASENHSHPNGSKHTSFCASFPGNPNDELSLAKKVARSSNSDIKSIILDPSDIPCRLLPDIARVEDPYLTMPFPMLDTYQAISNSKIKVCIDGHGADELFSGYGHIRRCLECVKTISEHRELLAIEESTRTGILSSQAKIDAKKLYKSILLAELRKKLSPLREVKPFLSLLINTLQGADSLAGAYGAKKRALQRHETYQALDVFNQLLYELFHLTILPTLLRNYDKYSMASGVEVRMPFMDWRLVAFSFSLPWQAKLGGGFTKRIHRDAMKGILIDEVRLASKKIGWNAPAEDWLANPDVSQWLYELVRKDSSKYSARARLALDTFLSKKDRRYADGEHAWRNLLPFLWEASMNEASWK